MEEGIVRITNPKGITKVIVIRITDWSQVQVLSDPPKIELKEFVFLSMDKTVFIYRHDGPSTYGIVKKGFGLELCNGYNVLVGANDCGKSTVLQLLFRYFCNSSGSGLKSVNVNNIVFIPSHRISIVETAEIGAKSFEEYNSSLARILHERPLHTGRLVDDGGNVSDLWALLLHHGGNFEESNATFKKLVSDLDFPVHKLGQHLVSHTGSVETTRHGSGLRALFPILAAVACKRIQVIIIDEPEESLEPYLQKKLKKVLIDSGKLVIVATHSHLFLSTDKQHSISVLEVNDDFLQAHKVNDERKLIDITYRLLGNSLEDLFFPNNFLIVEGSSDQIIVEKISEMLNIGPYDVKVLSARGMSNVDYLYTALSQTLVPLISGTTPYKDKVVVLIDNKNDINVKDFEDLQQMFGERFFHLEQKSLEEYLPEYLYIKAGRKKEEDLAFLCDKEKSYIDKEKLKMKISKELACKIQKGDLENLSVIVRALNKASGKKLEEPSSSSDRISAGIDPVKKEIIIEELIEEVEQSKQD